MTPEHQQQIWDEAKAYDHNYYKSTAILEPKDHYANGYLAAWNAREREIKELRDYLSTIAGWAGNLPDEHYTSRTGPNDAALRGSMVVAMRTLAKKALE